MSIMSLMDRYIFFPDSPWCTCPTDLALPVSKVDFDFGGSSANLIAISNDLGIILLLFLKRLLHLWSWGGTQVLLLVSLWSHLCGNWLFFNLKGMNCNSFWRFVEAGVRETSGCAGGSAGVRGKVVKSGAIWGWAGAGDAVVPPEEIHQQEEQQ